MWSPPNGQQRLRFGPFQADVSSGELYKLGRRVQLQDQPFRVLAMLLARPGEVVTREEVRKELYKRWRQRWIEEGMVWDRGRTGPPPDWNPREQLRNVVPF